MASSPAPDIVVVQVTDEGTSSDGPSSGGSSGNGSSGDGSSGGGGSNGGSSGGGSNGGSSDGGQDKNALEWLVLALGAAISLGVIGYLGYHVAFGSDEPADVRIVLDVGVPSADGSTAIVPVEVSNEGDMTAEGVVVEVCAGPDACGEVSFPYVPKGSKRKGSVGLSLPLAESPTSRVVSYREP